MTSYRTEIRIPSDRYICLQLPPDLPEGPAVVTVWIDPGLDPTAGPEPPAPHEGDRVDIEWWEEFDDPDA